MTINFENVLYLSGAAGATTKRTPAQIGTDTFNVKDYGALGNNSNDDTLAIRAAINAALGATTGATVFFPPGIYKVSHQGGDATDAAFFELVGGADAVRIIGAGKGATTITGACNFNMIFNQVYSNHGVTELSDMTIVNTSGNIGSGCVRLISTNSQVVLRDLDLKGMFCLDMGYFMATAININTTGSSAGIGSTPNYGGIGIHVAGGNVIGWNTASGGLQYGLVAGGNTGSAIIGCRCEEAVTGMLIGRRIGTGTLCTISGSVLTVGGHVYPDLTNWNFSTFNVGDFILGTGIPETAFVTIAPGGSGTGGTGTYNLTGASGITITSAVPMISFNLSGGPFCTLVSGFETEGLQSAIQIDGGTGVSIENCELSGDQTEAASVYGSNTTSPSTRVRVSNAGPGLSFRNIKADGACSLASIAFDTGASNSSRGVVFDNCTVGNGGSITTNATAFIDDGSSFPSPSGVAGNVLCLPNGSLTFPARVGIRARISGSGVPTGTATPYIDHESGSPSGSWVHQGIDGFKYILSADTGGAVSLNLSARSFTVTFGNSWGSDNGGHSTLTDLSGILAVQKAGVQIVNCDTANSASIQMHFADLPGQSGVVQPLLEGQEYGIIDAQVQTAPGVFRAASTADWGKVHGATTNGTQWTDGGTSHVRVRYNGSGWAIMAV